MHDSVNFVFATDPHITSRWPISRIDNYLEAIYGKMDWLIDFANLNRAHIINGGDYIDVYNTRSSITNTLLRKFRRAKLEPFGIIGNHDIYGHNPDVVEDVNIGSLFASGIVTLLTSDPVVIEENGIRVQLTGTSYFPNIDRDKRGYTVNKLPGVDYAIHTVHGYLVKKNISALEHGMYSLITEINTEADLICAGHEHIGFGIEQVGNTVYTNPGALGRISASLREIERIPRVTFIQVFKDRVDITLVDVPCMPGDKVLNREALEIAHAHTNTIQNFRAALEADKYLCNTDILFARETKKQRVDEDIILLCRKAIEEYEKKG